MSKQYGLRTIRNTGRRNRLEELKSTSYAIMLEQCSQGVMAKLEGQERYAEVKANWDLVGLLKLIQAICCNFEAKTKPYWALTGAKTCFALLWQDINTSIDK